MSEEFTPAGFAALFGNISAAAQLLNEDIEHFTSLTRDQMTRIYVAIKKMKPRPEFKDDHKFLIAQMAEEMEFADKLGTDPEIPVEAIDAVEDPVQFEVPKLSGLEVLGYSDPVTQEVVVTKSEQIVVAVMETTCDVDTIVMLCEREIAEIKARENANNYQNARKAVFTQILNMVRAA